MTNKKYRFISTQNRVKKPKLKFDSELSIDNAN